MTSVAARKRNRRSWNEALRAVGILPQAREKSGRKQRDSQADAARRQREAEEASRSVVLEARCRRRGLKPTPQNMEKMRDEKRGFVLGDLFLDGHLGPIGGAVALSRFEAGKKFAESDQAYRNATGLPPRTAQGASYGAVRGESGELDPERRAAEIAAHKQAQAVLRGSGIYARASVEAVCLDDDPPLSGVGLREGLDALVRHYGV